MLRSKKEVFSFRTLVSKICNHILYKPIYLNYNWYIFKESFKWHVKCYLNFWRLPKLLEDSVDYFYATESLNKDRTTSLESKNSIIESLMDEVVDDIWCIRLKGKNHDEISDEEKQEIHTEIKEKYAEYGLYCPKEYLTEKEFWDRAEQEHEDGILAMSGGPDYDDRPDVIWNAREGLKDSNFKSKYFGDWGIDE